MFCGCKIQSFLEDCLETVSLDHALQFYRLRSVTYQKMIYKTPDYAFRFYRPATSINCPIVVNTNVQHTTEAAK